MLPLPTASPYLQAVLSRWNERQNALRAESDAALDSAKEKRLYLNDLQNQIRRHRREDVNQLSEAREDASRSWDERLRRLEEWIASSETSTATIGRAAAWRDGERWFDRAQHLLERAGRHLDRRAELAQRRLTALRESMSQWMDRLMAKEAELRNATDLTVDSAGNFFVSAARKKPLMDFVLAERDQESRLRRDQLDIKQSIRWGQNRLDGALRLAEHHADALPAAFELRKQAIDETIRQLSPRLDAQHESLMVEALRFEEGRKRLRDIYEAVSRLRLIEDVLPPQPQRSWLTRLVSYEKD